MSASRTADPQTTTFRIGDRSGVWFVTKDKTFYGDYRSRDQAIAAATFGARAAEAMGRAAQVLAMADESVIPHKLKPAAKVTAPKVSKAAKKKA